MIVPGSASPLLTTTENGGYTISKSLRFRNDSTAYLQRTFSTPTNRSKWTWSGWVKRSKFGIQQGIFAGGDGTNSSGIVFTPNNTLHLYDYVSSAFVTDVKSIQVFRDPSSWYHIVASYDTTQATSSNRVKLFVNGVQLTAFSPETYPSQNYANGLINAASATARIGKEDIYNYYLDGCLADVNFIDGQALTASSFGETDATTGVWKPKAYSGTYGTNGFYLKFTDVATTSGSNAGLGKDFSGNGNYWTTNNISVTSGATYDSMKDVPTLTDANTANYAVINPLAIGGGTISNANLTYAKTADPSGSLAGKVLTTMAFDSGKWYFEYVIASSTSSIALGVTTNIQGTTNTIGGTNYVGNQSYEYCWRSNGQTINNTSFVNYGSSATNTDIVMVAFDVSGGKIWWGKNGTWFNSSDPATATSPAFSGLSGTMMPILGIGTSSASFTADGSINFGQRPFSYTPPTGFKALNTYNLPDSTIKAGNKYMDATLYTGNGSTQTITNAGGFKPDLVWIKCRNAAGNNELANSISGVQKYLRSNSTNAEASDTNSLQSFNSNGFSVGVDGDINGSGETNVAWQWQAGQGSTSSNTSGSITSTVSVNASAGFSIVTYTGNGATPSATIGHGLGVAPTLVIVKPRVATGVSDNWQVGSTALGWTKFLELNATTAETTITNRWNNTAPTSTVITLGDVLTVSGKDYVAFCWAEIAGFSKFGSWTGNGSTDGPFIYFGFRPKFVMIKRTTGTPLDSWYIVDTSRSTYNVTEKWLIPNALDAEGSGVNFFDVLSNGIKIRGSGGYENESGANYIYMAFAENPFKNALAR